MQNIIAIENGVTRHPLYRMKEPVNMTLATGEHIAVVGRNGAGKSILVDTITGRWPLLMNEVKYDFSLFSFEDGIREYKVYCFP